MQAHTRKICMCQHLRADRCQMFIIYSLNLIINRCYRVQPNQNVENAYAYLLEEADIFDDEERVHR